MKWQTFLTFVLIFSISNIDAQSISDLEQLIETEQDETKKVELQIEVADLILWENEAIERAEEYALKAAEFCKNKACKDEYWLLLNAVLAEVAINKGNYAKSDSLMIPAIEQNAFPSDKIKSRYLELGGVTKLINGQSDEAINWLKESCELLLNNNKEDKRLCTVYLYLSYCYNSISQNDSSILYMDKSLSGSEAIKDSVRIVDALVGLSNLYGTDGKYDEAIVKMLEAVSISEQNKKLKERKYTLSMNIANLYIDSEKYENAEEILAEAIPELTQTKIPLNKKNKDLWAMNLTMAKLLGKLKRPLEGLVYVDSSEVYARSLNEHRVTISDLYRVQLNLQLDRIELGHAQLISLHEKIKRTGDHSMKLSILKLFYDLTTKPNVIVDYQVLSELKPTIADVLEKNKDQTNLDVFRAEKLSTIISIYENNKAKAISSYASVLEMKDSFVNKEKIKITNELMVKYETEQKNKELAEQELQISKEKNQKSYLFALAIAFLFISSVLLIYYNQKRKYAQNLETEVEKRTEELQKSNESLSRSNEELARYTYIASHDLKEPLRNIGSFVNLIERKSMINGAEGQQYFDYVKKGTIQMNRIVDDILEYSELRNYKSSINKVNISLLTEYLENEANSRFGKGNFRLNFNNFPSSIQSDNKLLSLLFKNIIENGLKYNNSHEPKMDVSYLKVNNEHQFMFKDNGIGIDKAYFKTIFTIFKRLHNREEYQGSGVGLAMCERIINYFNGKIAIDSELEKGTVFKVSLPVE